MPPPAALRVALISEHASPLACIGGVDAGGQNIYVAEVARALAALGHQVDVLTRRDDARSTTVVPLGERVRVLHIDAGPPRFVEKEALLPHMAAFGRDAARHFLHGRRYDIVHANFFMSGLVGLQLQQRFGVPLVTTFHALGRVRREHQREADRFPPERLLIEDRVVHGSARVIAECPQDADDLQRLYGADPRRIETVPCGVDTAVFRPGDQAAARHRLGLAADEFIVLQLGRLVPRKGIDNVVRAIALLPAACRVRLVVVGGESPQPCPLRTPEIGRLQTLAAQLGVGARVSFVGRRDPAALRDWYVACDVFVTTPWYEPFGITPLEAMACAAPVIGSAVGGIKHTVVDGVTGCLVPPHAPPLLAERLAALQADPARAPGAWPVRAARVRCSTGTVSPRRTGCTTRCARCSAMRRWRAPGARPARPMPASVSASTVSSPTG